HAGLHTAVPTAVLFVQNLEIIDRCQNHLLGGSKVRRHYLHHDYAKEKTEAWRLLGEKLEMILLR
ncbi:hypothetical protein VUS63_32915, partial [Pseudomonas aeruginosa]